MNIKLSADHSNVQKRKEMFFFQPRNRNEEGTANADPYLQMIISNLEPEYTEFKDKIRELDDLSELLKHIRRVERVIDQNKAVDDEETAKILENKLNETRDILIDILNDDQSRDLQDCIGYGFRTLTNDLIKRIREIDDDIFPPETQPNRSSKYLPPILQRTSRKITKTLVNTLTSGTKYRNYTRMASWEKRKYYRRITMIAFVWSLALTGLILSIGFLTFDFVNAQKNLAVQVERSFTQTMQLPAITICSDEFSIPTFANFPTKDRPGLPLFSIVMYRHSNRSMKQKERTLWFRKTAISSDSPVESVYVTNRKDKSCLNSEIGFDVHREQRSSLTTSILESFSGFGKFENNNSICRHCFRFGVKQRELIIPYNKKESVAQFKPTIQIIVSKSRLYGSCYTTYMSNSIIMEKLISSQLYKHAKQLEERNILNFNGYNHSTLLKSLNVNGSGRYMEFYCNTYFFSGYFYPTLHHTNISYIFTSKAPNIWEKVNNTGPYFSAYSWNENDPFTIGPNKEVLDRDRYSLGGIRLYAESADSSDSEIVSSQTEFAVLSRFESGSIFNFKKMNILGNTEYRSKKYNSLKISPMSALADHFRIGFDFETFEEERVYTYATMSWSEFVTDIFEFVGLFTGLCIFTLIVAPALRIKRYEGED